jgi:hypothetical protein
MPQFTITFTADPTALGGYLEFRYILPSLPVQYSPWQTDLSVGNNLGLFPISTATVTLTVSGNLPHYQTNTVYQFRVKQVCADGTEVYSEIDGDYYECDCPISTQFFYNNKVDVAGGGPTVEISFYHTPESSVIRYIASVYELTPPLGIPVFKTSYIVETIPNIDTTGNNLNTIVINNPNLIADGVPSYSIPSGVAHMIILTPVLLLSNVTFVSCGNQCTPFTFTFNCSSYEVSTYDAWGMKWMDCDGITHEVYSLEPYNTGVTPNTKISLCSMADPSSYYCDDTNGITPGALVVGGNTQRGITYITLSPTCLAGYSDYPTGLEDANGNPVGCPFIDVDPNCECI